LKDIEQFSLKDKNKKIRLTIVNID